MLVDIYTQMFTYYMYIYIFNIIIRNLKIRYKLMGNKVFHKDSASSGLEYQATYLKVRNQYYYNIGWPITSPVFNFCNIEK